MMRKTMMALRLLAVIACLGFAEMVGSLALKGEAPHWLKLCGLVSLVLIRPIVGDARHAAVRVVPR